MGMTTVSESVCIMVKYSTVPSLGRLPYLRRHVSNLRIHRVKNIRILPGDRINQPLFNPFGYPVEQTAHRLLTEQAGQQRDQRHTHNGNASSRHELLDSL